jgi:hypothetical protein
MKIIGWDTETHLIEPGNLTPRFVCLTAYGGEDTLEAFTRWLDGRDRGPSLWTRITGECWEVLVTRDLALDFFVWALGVADRTVAHNAAFDWGVMCNEFPEVLPIHAALMEQGKVADTRVREQLWAIATDNFKYDRRVGKAEPGFSLSHCVEARLGIKLGTKSRITDTGKVLGNPDAWRLRYSELDGVPADQWPEAAISYAVDDARWAYDVYQHQAQPLDLPAGTVVGSDGTLTNETEQTAAAWVLHLMACHGVYTDAPRVESFHKEVEALVASAERAGRKAGFVVINRCKTCEGTGVQGGRPCRQCEGADHDTMLTTGAYGIRKNGKAIAPAAPKTKTRRSRLQALVTAAYNGDPPMTERPANASATWKPQVSTSADTLLGSGHPLLEEYAQGSFAIKLLQTYYPILLRGIEVPVTSYPQVLVRSGRTSWRNPNFQNPPQKGGFRECFIPREGKVFASIDYTALEMCTLAQACLTLFGFSRMAEAINQGRDLHCGFAGQVLRSRGMHLSDDDVERILGKGVHEGQPAEKDHPLYAECAKARQEAKAGNFGFPGGLGVAAFVKFAKGSGVNLTFNQAEDLRSAWFERWEEMRPYFDMISDACDTNPDGRFTVKQLGSNRLRGGCSYTSGANTWFQGLAADGAKAAMWALYKACYVDTDSPLYGVRMWAFIHDEFLFEGDEDTAHLWAPAAARIMVAEMKKYTPDVKVGAEPALMRRWLKGAEPVYTPDGKLTLWSLESR